MKKTAILASFLVLFAATAAFAGEWTGQIVKKDGKIWFKSGEKTYSVANPGLAKGFENQKVKLMGNIDAATKAVTIKSLAKAS